MKVSYKGLHQSTENHWNFFIKVNFFVIFNFFIRRNTIFSRMNIIFLNDTGNVIIATFLTEGCIIFVGKRNSIFTEYTENIIFPCIF